MNPISQCLFVGLRLVNFRSKYIVRGLILAGIVGLIASPEYVAAGGKCWEIMATDATQSASKEGKKLSENKSLNQKKDSEQIRQLEASFGPILRDLPVYVLDTNVLINDPKSIHTLKGNIFIPHTVLAELDSIKQRVDKSEEIKAKVRASVRELNNARTQHIAQSRNAKLDQNSSAGIQLENGSLLFFVPEAIFSTFKPAFSLDLSVADNRILSVAAGLNEIPEIRRQVLIFSEDLLMQLKAHAEGVLASSFKNRSEELTLENHVMDKGLVHREVSIPVDEYIVMRGKEELSFEEVGHYISTDDLQPNQFIVFRPTDAANSNEYLIGMVKVPSRKDGEFDYSRTMIHIKEIPFNTPIRPMNIQQEIALIALMDESVPLVIIDGAAGSGKTLMTMLAGALQTGIIPGPSRPRYSKIGAYKSNVETGEKIGYLPGTLEEKIEGYMKPYKQSLELIFSRLNHRQDRSDEQVKESRPLRVSRKDRNKKPGQMDNLAERASATILTNPSQASINKAMETGKLVFDALTHIRGTTLYDYVVIDEAQNLPTDLVKTFITRAGHGAKFVLLGDSSQIDHEKLSESNNGLQVAIETLNHHPLVAHVKMGIPVRSPLAKFAVDRFRERKLGVSRTSKPPGPPNN